MRHDTLPGRIGTIVSMSLGYLFLHLIGAAGVMILFSPYFETAPERLPATVVVSEGQPLRQIPWQVNQSWVYQTVDGQPVTLREKQPLMLGAFLGTAESQKQEPFSIRPARWSTVLFGVGPDSNEVWYFIQEQVGDEFTAYFVAYSNRTRTPLLYLGVNGETTEVPPPDQRFKLSVGSQGIYADGGSPITYRGTDTMLDTGSTVGTTIKEYVVLLSKRGVEHIYPKLRRVQLMIAKENLISFAPLHEHEFVSGSVSTKFPPSQPSLILRSSDFVYQVNEGRIIAEYKIPEEIRGQIFTAFPVDSNTICYATTFDRTARWLVACHNVFRCDATGQILEKLKVQQPEKNFLDSGMVTSLLIAVACPVPLQIVTTTGMVDGVSLVEPESVWQQMWPSMLVLLVLSIFSVVTAMRLAPQYSGVAIKPGWLVYIALFGIPGLVGYLMHFRHRYRPVLEPAPKLGTEIFG